MRPHLIKCFESQEITPFPTTKHKNIFILKRKLRHTIQIACECGMADELEDMVQCEGSCSNWFHYACAKSSGTPQVKTWKCQNCIKIPNVVQPN